MFRGIILIHNWIGTIKLHVFQLMIDLWQNLRIRLYIQYAVVNYRQIDHATKMLRFVKIFGSQIGLYGVPHSLFAGFIS